MTRPSDTLRIRGIAATAGAVVVGLALTGCAGGAAAPAQDGELLASVDTMFGTVDIPQPADGELTVVALGWSDAEFALALGVKPVAVYDWMGFGEDSKGVGPWAVERYGDESPTVLQRVDDGVDYEAVQALEPDLILNVSSANDQEQFERLSSIAPTVFGPAGAPAYAVPWREHMELVADALGKTDEGGAIIDETQAVIDAATEDNPEFAGLTAVTGSKFGDAYGASLAGDFRWDLLAELGFELNPPVSDLEAQGFYAPVSVEQISVFDADVAVLFPIGYTVAELEADPLISSLNVVKQDRAVILDPENDLVNAFSVASTLSIPTAVEGIVPMLADAASKATS